MSINFCVIFSGAKEVNATGDMTQDKRDSSEDDEDLEKSDRSRSPGEGLFILERKRHITWNGCTVFLCMCFILAKGDTSDM